MVLETKTIDGLKRSVEWLKGLIMLDFITKEPINKGWSGDKKYCVTTADGTKFLLRVTHFEKSANRKNMYRMQKEVEKLGVPMCKPVDFDECDEGVYTLQTWIDGKDANEVVPYLADSEQYALGIEAGRILKKFTLSLHLLTNLIGKFVLTRKWTEKYKCIMTVL